MNSKNIRLPAYLENPYPFPSFHKIRVDYPRPGIDSLAESIKQVVDQQLLHCGLKKGASICIGVGSRGIRDIDVIVSLTVGELKSRGFHPFIIPAMGSHGGASPEGQIKTLASLGMTEETCGCPIRSSFDVRQIGTVNSEVPVYFSRDALEADASICINRIKPHTKFKAPLESGVFKMLCVGMGKHQGALTYHKWALKFGFFDLLKAVGDCVFAQSNFRFGIGIVENAYDETMLVEGLNRETVHEREAELLAVSKENMPRLPVIRADVLVVRQIGKDISGAGMDPNVTGRAADLMEDDFSQIFQATRLAVLDLSPTSKGNALGMGNADIVTRKVVDALDYEVTLMNILTSISLRKASIPVIMPNDEKAIQACFTTIGPVPPEAVKALIIKDTLHLDEMWVSRAVFEAIRDKTGITSLKTGTLRFSEAGNLIL